MDSHTLSGLVAQLASVVNNLQVASAGPDSRTLLAQSMDLNNLALTVIAQDLNASLASYQDAVTQVQSAVDRAKVAEKDIAKVSAVIQVVAQAIKVVSDLVKV